MLCNKYRKIYDLTVILFLIILWVAWTQQDSSCLEYLIWLQLDDGWVFLTHVWLRLALSMECLYTASPCDLHFSWGCSMEYLYVASLYDLDFLTTGWLGSKNTYPKEPSGSYVVFCDLVSEVMYHNFLIHSPTHI